MKVAIACHFFSVPMDKLTQVCLRYIDGCRKIFNHYSSYMIQSSITMGREAFLEAYDKHADAIFKHCYFRLFNRERAKEIMQDTFLRAWEQMAKGVEIKNIKAFLYRIATNLIIDDTRKKKTSSLDLMQGQGFNPAVSDTDAIFNRLDGERVKKMIERMDEKYATVILMRYVDDLTVKEISEILSVTQNVVSVRIHRGLKEIKKIIYEESK